MEVGPGLLSLASFSGGNGGNVKHCPGKAAVLKRSGFGASASMKGRSPKKERLRGGMNGSRPRRAVGR